VKREAKEAYPPHLQRAIEEAIARDSDDYQERRAITKHLDEAAEAPRTAQEPPKVIAKGSGKPRQMNQLERDYAGHLFAARSAGEILWYEYEAITLRLGHDCRYTPDFFVELANGELELRECKGPHRWEDSIVKLRTAAAKYPFRFYLVERDGMGWKTTEVKP
jgi:hypothetical protein